MKKWPSYREYALLGRPLAPEEARTLSEVARRLAALRLLEPALDANYNAVRAETYPWPRTERERATGKKGSFYFISHFISIFQILTLRYLARATGQPTRQSARPGALAGRMTARPEPPRNALARARLHS